jgi:hypothetical protein
LYLPQEIPDAKVLITVKTYPLPSSKYKELVCTAGLYEGKKWIRIYPIAFRFLENGGKYPKYSWIEINLIRNEKDFRPESYRPRSGIEEKIRLVSKIGTSSKWAERKTYVLQEVFSSMTDLIDLAKSDKCKSLATLKPKEIIDFIWKDDDRNWKEKWITQSKQGNIFELSKNEKISYDIPLINKLPYKYYYKFITDGDDKPRTVMIEDWEIGALFWNCLRRTDGDEKAANELVKQKYFYEFLKKCDIYLFLGTTKLFHLRAPNPFVIVGVFYPPQVNQLSFLK